MNSETAGLFVTVNMPTLLLYWLCFWQVQIVPLTMNFASAHMMERGQALTVIESSDDNYDSDVSIENGEESERSADIFNPTHEWKVIEEGQAIPKGLHVRMNFQTGINEAKLLDGTEEPAEEKGHKQEPAVFKRWTDGTRRGMLNKNSRTFTRDELKMALKEFKTDDQLGKDLDEDANDATRKKFKSYAELRKEMEKLNMNVKTDMEIVKELMGEYETTDSDVGRRVKILSDLEYYVHQVDNAGEFVRLGGLKLLSKELNSSISDLRSSAAHVLGSASQSNPGVQIAAIEADILPQLLRVMSSADNNEREQSRALFALAALVRNFPLAQEKFAKCGGVAALSGFFRRKTSAKLKIKAVTLIYDLLKERELTKKHAETDAEARVKLKQYERLELDKVLVEEGWCENVRSLLASTDHDTREKVLNAMLSLRQQCGSHFKSDMAHIRTLFSEYEQLATEQYFEEMLELVGSVKESLQNIASKDEL